MLNKKNYKKRNVHNIFRNIFITILNSRLLLVNQKKKINGKFKLKPVKTYHLGFVVKMLQKCCGYSTSQKLSKQISLKSRIKHLIVIF